jgi:carnitine O-acetyltransferase
LFKTSGSWEISTSNISDDAYEGFGFGQVIPHGIGCGYQVMGDKIVFNCTTRKDKTDGSPQKMCQMLRECLHDMKNLSAVGGVQKPILGYWKVRGLGANIRY